MGESNTAVSAYTKYRHLQQYCSLPMIFITMHLNTLIDRIPENSEYFMNTKKTCLYSNQKRNIEHNYPWPGLLIPLA